MLGEKRLESVQKKKQKKSSKEWFNSIKSAILLEDLDRLESLAKGDLPKFENAEEMRKAQFLIREILLFLVEFQGDLKTKMKKVKKNIKNLKSLLEPIYKLDRKA